MTRTWPFPWPRIDWARHLARWDDYLLWAGMLAFFLYIGIRSPEMVAYRGDLRRVDELVSQAKADGVAYETARRDPAAAKGKVVFWPITHPGDFWFVDDDRRMPVIWEGGEPDMEHSGQSGSPRGEHVAAVVAGADARGVILSYRARYSDSSGLRRKTSRNSDFSPSDFWTAPQ